MWRMVKIEDTNDWPADGALRTRGIRTWSHFAYDDEARTFCCEITPSRCLWYLGYTWDLAEGVPPLGPDEAEYWHDFVCEHGRPDTDVRYRHCSSADRIPFEDVTMHLDEEDRIHNAECTDTDCRCEERCANAIREWAVTGEIT